MAIVKKKKGVKAKTFKGFRKQLNFRKLLKETKKNHQYYNNIYKGIKDKNRYGK